MHRGAMSLICSRFGIRRTIEAMASGKLLESCLLTPPNTVSVTNDQSSASINVVTENEKAFDVVSSETVHLDSSGDISNDFKSMLKLADKPNTEEEPVLQTCYESANYRKQKSGFGDFEEKVCLNRTLMVPVKKYPKYNFVGRIIGPRGMTVKQLEKETGCKIFVKGRASSSSFNPHTKMLCGGVISNKSALSAISQGALTDEPLHVYIECLDYKSAAQSKIENAVEVISQLLSPPPDGKDELKRQQLVDISLINGTYRPTTATAVPIHRPRGKWGRPSVDPTSNPVDYMLDENANGDGSSVYGIPQQKRSWQKPRGPDSTSEEFAKSTASREFVTDIVNKTKQVSRGFDFSEDYTNAYLPQSVVSDSLKIANSLIASHQQMPFVPKTNTYGQVPSYSNNQPMKRGYDYSSIPPLMSAPHEPVAQPPIYVNTPQIHSNYYPSPPSPYLYQSNDPHPYFPPGLFYMLPPNFNQFFNKPKHY